MTPQVFAARATASFPLMQLDGVLLIMVLYGIMVAYGYIKYTAYLAAKRNASGAKEELSLEQKLNKEPVVYQVMIPYNVVQVLLCAYMIAGALYAFVTGGYLPICNPHNYADSKVAGILWVFYVSKVLDFVDTFLIIARNKWDQFSFLHIYHHFSIFFVYWIVTNVGFDGDVYYTVVANSFVHLVMYSYYYLTAFNFKPVWGRYVTQLQMGQFVTMMLQAIFILARGCDYPNRLTAVYLVYIMSLFALFKNFDNKRWKAAKAAKAAKEAAAGAAGEDTAPAKARGKAHKSE